LQDQREAKLYQNQGVRYSVALKPGIQTSCTTRQLFLIIGQTVDWGSRS